MPNCLQYGAHGTFNKDNVEALNGWQTYVEQSPETVCSWSGLVNCLFWLVTNGHTNDAIAIMNEITPGSLNITTWTASTGTAPALNTPTRIVVMGRYVSGQSASGVHYFTNPKNQALSTPGNIVRDWMGIASNMALSISEKFPVTVVGEYFYQFTSDDTSDLGSASKGTITGWFS